MRLSVKVAPGVRLSGRIGGRHHHHHHYRRRGGGTWANPNPRTGGWLHNVPPWRIPLPRAYGLGSLLGMLILAEIGFAIWCYEAALWVAVWFYYGLFLTLRWCWRNNPIGQTIDSASSARARRAPTVDAPATYVDLGKLDQ